MSVRKKKRRIRYPAQEPFRISTERIPDGMELLAYKYKEKCRVESSTESESDTYIEALMNPILGSAKKPDVTKHLDPYDGDSENTSSQSDSTINHPEDIYIDEPGHQSHSLVATDEEKLREFQEASVVMNVESVCTSIQLDTTVTEPVLTPDESMQSGSESAVQSKQEHEQLETDGLVPDTKCGEQGLSPSFGVLTVFPPVNTGIGELAILNMLTPGNHGDDEPRHRDFHHHCSMSVLKPPSGIVKEKLSSKRKLGNSMMDAGNEKMRKKKWWD